MEILIVVAIMTVVVKRGVEDVLHAARGNPPARYAAARRGGSGAWSRYWRTLSDDVAADLLKKHIAKRANPNRPRGPFRTFLSNWWRDGWVRAERRRQGKATRPRPETVTVPGEVVPDFEDGPEDGDGSRPVPDPHIVPTEDGRTDLTFGDDPTDPTGVSSCPECGGTGLTEDGVCLSCRDRQEQRNQHWDQQEDGIETILHSLDKWEVVLPDGSTRLTNDPDLYDGYRIQPVGGWKPLINADGTEYHPTSQEGTTMTATTIEVTGLESGIKFSETSAQAYTAMVGSIEQTIAALGGFDVGGPAKAAADAAMEQSAAAAQSMLTLAEELKKHRGVAEAIDATPGAGKREFYTAGR